MFVFSAAFNTIFGGGVPLSGRAVAQDGRRVRALELGSQRRTLWSLSRPPALGNTELRSHRPFVHLPRLSLQEHVDVHHPPLRTERVLRLLGTRDRIGVGLAPVSVAKQTSLVGAAKLGSGRRAAPALLLAPIHPNAWKGNSRKFTERLQKILQLSDALCSRPPRYFRSYNDRGAAGGRSIRFIVHLAPGHDGGVRRSRERGG